MARRCHCHGRSPARPRGWLWCHLQRGDIRCFGVLCPSSALCLGRDLPVALPGGGTSRGPSSPGGARPWCRSGAGALAPLPSAGPAPSRCSPMSSSASLIVSFNTASWPKNNRLGHLANVYGSFIAGGSARRERASPGNRAGGMEPWNCPAQPLHPPGPWGAKSGSVRAPGTARTLQAAVPTWGWGRLWALSLPRTG